MTERRLGREIVVVGAGGFGRETLDVIDAINDAAASPVWRVLGVVDDAPSEVQIARLRARGMEILGGMDALPGLTGLWSYVVAIGAPSVRARLASLADAAGGQAATIVHPAAVVGTRVSIESGAVICAGAQLSTNLRVGAHVHINPAAIIGHDTQLGDFVSINPGAIVSGEVTVNAGTLVGAGATLLQGISIGRDAVVGASACVTKDVVDGSTVIGIPARRVKT